MPKRPFSEEALTEGRRTIGRAAEKLMSAHGTTALSMRVLAEEVGLTAGAIYRYFPSKAELLAFCWSEALEALAQRFREIDSSDLGPADSLSDMLLAYASFGLEDIDRFRVLFMPTDSTTQGANVEPVPEAFLLAMKQADLAVEADILVDISPDTALRILWSSVHGMLALKDSDPSPDFRYDMELLSTSIDVALHGLSSRRPTK